MIEIPMAGTLYLVATPIGNLNDMSPRAVETLRSVDIIACEDTRHSRKLLDHFAISKKLVSYHEHNEEARSDEFLRLLENGHSVAVISDAGTPAVSDPGSRLVTKAIKTGVNVVPIPGPVAFVCAAIVSGLPTDALFYGGFLPARSGERRRRLEETKEIPATLIFYESPHRLSKSLLDCAAVLGPRDAAVVREMTKIHEEAIRMNLGSLAEHFAVTPVKGEIVIVIGRGVNGPAIDAGYDLASIVRRLESEGMDRRAAIKRAAKDAGLSRSEVYRRLQAERSK
ncbi:MAG: 16S rRNA (cytidine(1402)-2'-O)-methyltransferase [Acidobacteriota bacterium]